MEGSTGWSRDLRERLRQAREDLGLTQAEVARRIAASTGGHYTGSAVGQVERFVKHPPISILAAHARAVGLRLVVNLDGADSNRVQVLVPREIADSVWAFAILPEQHRTLVQSLIETLSTKNQPAAPKVRA